MKKTKILAAILLCVMLTGCAKSGKVLTQQNEDTALGAQFEDYTGEWERTLTIKNTQSAVFETELSAQSGTLELEITDADGETVLAANEKSELQDGRTEVSVEQGNGAYHIKAKASGATGSFAVSWTVSDRAEPYEEPSDWTTEDILCDGVVVGCDAARGTVSFIYTEWIDEGDTQRIAQLKEIGIDPDFPNGYYLYQPSNDVLTSPTAKDVKVALLRQDGEAALYIASLSDVADYIAHPEGEETPFLLVNLTIKGGVIVEMDQIYTP